MRFHLKETGAVTAISGRLIPRGAFAVHPERRRTIGTQNLVSVAVAACRRAGAEPSSKLPWQSVFLVVVTAVTERFVGLT